MQSNKIKKDWYTKKDILDIYPIGITTYKKRIQKLKEESLKPYTRIISNEMQNSNLGYNKVREIHFSVLDELFCDIRQPSLDNKEAVKKWVNYTKWDWFCEITPSNSYPSDLKYKMEHFFKQLKKHLKIKGLILFYNIEKNTRDEYYHSHFLIKDFGNGITKNILYDLLQEICEENSKSEHRIYIDQYDYISYGNRGSNYLLKDMNTGYDILS